MGKKRKVVTEISDDEEESLVYRKASSRSKKARMSTVFSDGDEDEDEDEEPKLNSFAKRLTKYQKSPSKGKGRGKFTILQHENASLIRRRSKEGG